jgi:hypothetical protein
MSRDVVRPRVTIVFSGFFYLGRWAWPLASHPAAWISRHRRARIFLSFLKKINSSKTSFLNRLSQFDMTYKEVTSYILTTQFYMDIWCHVNPIVPTTCECDVLLPT